MVKSTTILSGESVKFYESLESIYQYIKTGKGSRLQGQIVKHNTVEETVVTLNGSATRFYKVWKIQFGGADMDWLANKTTEEEWHHIRMGWEAIDENLFTSSR